MFGSIRIDWKVRGIIDERILTWRDRLEFDIEKELFVKNPNHFYHYRRYYEIGVIHLDSWFSLFVLENRSMWRRRRFSARYLPSSCFIFINSCSLMYLNCRAESKHELIEEKRGEESLTFRFWSRIFKTTFEKFLLIFERSFRFGYWQIRLNERSM